MKKFFILIIVSFIGLGYATYKVVQFEKPARGSAKPLPVFQPPFSSYVAALGVLEPSSKEIVVGTKVSGIIKAVYVKEGDGIKQGEPLFCLDDSDLRLKIDLQKEKIALAKTKMLKYKDIYDIAKKLWENARGTISKKEYKIALDDYLGAKELLRTEKQRLEILKKKIPFYTILSPINGIVLKNRLSAGMYMEASSRTPSYMTIGSNSFTLIAQVDEFMAHKIEKGAKAVAFVRGDPNRKIALEFDYIRPVIEGKTIFLHSPLERADAKVLQVVYKVEKSAFPLYVGEVFDVYIEAK